MKMVKNVQAFAFRTAAQAHKNVSELITTC